MKKLTLLLLLVIGTIFSQTEKDSIKILDSDNKYIMTTTRGKSLEQIDILYKKTKITEFHLVDIKNSDTICAKRRETYIKLDTNKLNKG